MLTKEELKKLILEIKGTAGGEDTVSVSDVLEMLIDFTEKEEENED